MNKHEITSRSAFEKNENPLLLEADVLVAAGEGRQDPASEPEPATVETFPLNRTSSRDSMTLWSSFSDALILWSLVCGK